MSPEPRRQGDYADRQVEAARRVLIDVGQVLASFRDSIVVVGGAGYLTCSSPMPSTGTSEASTSTWLSTRSSSAAAATRNC